VRAVRGARKLREPKQGKTGQVELPSFGVIRPGLIIDTNGLPEADVTGDDAFE
jgi:hypothetical protein